MKPKGKKSNYGAWVLGAFVAILFYVLSFGPATYLCIVMSIGNDALNIAYAPVGWLYQNTPLQGPLDAYQLFWINLTVTEGDGGID